MMKVSTKFEVDTTIRCLVIALLLLIRYVTFHLLTSQYRRRTNAVVYHATGSIPLCVRRIIRGTAWVQGQMVAGPERAQSTGWHVNVKHVLPVILHTLSQLSPINTRRRASIRWQDSAPPISGGT